MTCWMTATLKLAYLGGLMQERHNSIANILELHFSCTHPLIYGQILLLSLQWRHNGRNSVSNHQPHHCLLNGLFRRRSKKTSKLRITGLCVGNLPGTGEFPAQMASNTEKSPFDDVIMMYVVGFVDSWHTKPSKSESACFSYTHISS